MHVSFRISVLKREDWKSFVDLITNARQVISSIQGVALKVAEYAKFGNKPRSSGKLFHGCVCAEALI